MDFRVVFLLVPLNRLHYASGIVSVQGIADVQTGNHQIGIHDMHKRHNYHSCNGNFSKNRCCRLLLQLIQAQKQKHADKTPVTYHNTGRYI